MATFTLNGREYELLTFDNLDDLELGHLTILEDYGRLNLSDLADGDVGITSRLLRALMVASVVHVEPDADQDAVFAATARVPISVLNALMSSVANSEGDDGDAVPPTTEAAADGLQP